MDEIKIFENPAFGRVRTIVKDDKPWFVAKDIANALGYKNTAKAVSTHVDEDEKGVTKVTTRGGLQTVVIVNESGLYSLAFGSELKSAKEFRKWVTSEVLPAIRKTGGYIAGSENMSDAEIMARALLVAQKTIEQNQKKITEMTPKAVFADAVATSDDCILIGELAKILAANGAENMGQNRLFRLLRNQGFLIKRKGSDYNMPTQKAMELKLFKIKETVISHADGHTSINKTVKVTGKGQIYFCNYFLKKKEGDLCG